MNKIGLIFLLLLSLGLNKIPKSNYRIKAWVDQKRILIGDPIKLTVAIVHRTKDLVHLSKDVSFKPFEVLSRKSEKKTLSKNKAQSIFKIILTVYKVGKFNIPTLNFSVVTPKGKVLNLKTNKIPIKVKGLIENEPNPKLKDIMPPVKFLETNWVLIRILGAIGGVGLVVVVTLLLRGWIKTPTQMQTSKPLIKPFHEVALEKLVALQKDKLWEKNRFMEYYIKISEIIREYLGQRYEFDSMEMTTEEIIKTLKKKKTKGLSLPEVEGFLGECDLVKFAKYRPLSEESLAILELAFKIVKASSNHPLPDEKLKK
jgi:hypothetical protein